MGNGRTGPPTNIRHANENFKNVLPDCEKGKPLPIPMSPLNVVCAPDSASRPRMSMPVELFQSSNSHRLQLVIAPAVNFHPLYILSLIHI